MYLDASLQHTESSQHTEINHHSMEEELHHPNVICARDPADDQGCSIQGSETTSDKGNYGSSMNADRHGRTGVYGLSYLIKLMSWVKVVNV